MIELFNRMGNLWWSLKGRLFYASQFAAFGRGTILQTPTFLSGCQYIHIGDQVLIRKGVRLEVLCPSGNAAPRIVIGSGCNIEQNVHIVCKDRIEIGRNVSITANCCIVDVTHPYDIGNDKKIGDTVASQASFVVIEDGCFVGVGSVILPNVRIGERSVIGANSVVADNVPPYSVVAGNPARLLKTYR